MKNNSVSFWQRTVDLFVVSKLFGLFLIMLSSVLAYTTKADVERIADTGVETKIIYAIQPLSHDATPEQIRDQVEKIKWNHSSKKLDEVHSTVMRRSFVDKFCESPA